MGLPCPWVIFTPLFHSGLQNKFFVAVVESKPTHAYKPIIIRMSNASLATWKSWTKKLARIYNVDRDSLPTVAAMFKNMEKLETELVKTETLAV